MRLFALLVAAAALVGCGTSSSMSFTKSGIPHKPMTPRRAADVQMLAIPPARPFVEVGVLIGREGTAWGEDDETEILAEMRARAGREGCDALVLLGTSNSVTNGTGIAKVQHGFVGTCILFTAPSMLKAGVTPNVIGVGAVGTVGSPGPTNGDAIKTDF